MPTRRRVQKRSISQTSLRQGQKAKAYFKPPSSTMEAVSEKDLEGMRQAVEILGNEPAQSGGMGSESSIGKDRRGNWQISLRPGLPGESNVHELSHIKHTSFDALEKADLPEGPVKNLWNIIEDGRVDRMGEEWFGKPLRAIHRETFTHEKPASPTTEEDALITAVADSAFGMEMPPSYNYERVDKAIALYGADIAEAVASDDPNAPLSIALRVSHYMDYLKRKEEERQASTQQGESESLPPEEDKAQQQGKGRGEQPEGKGQQERKVSDKEEREASDKEVERSPRLQKMQREFAGQVGAHQQAKSSAHLLANRFTYGAVLHPKNPSFENHHVLIYQDMAKQQESIVTDERVKLMLDSLPDTAAYPRLAYSGEPTPDVWKLNIGNLKVFSHRPKESGRLVLMVDMSGSMGDSCEKHNAGLPGMDEVSNGFLAWQIAGAIAAKHPGVEIFGFWSSDHDNWVVPMPHGMRPPCFRKLKQEARVNGGKWNRPGWTAIPTGGNADCAILMWLRDFLGGDMAATRAVIISDGYPNRPFPVHCDSRAHTERIAKEMCQDGIKYASVLIQTRHSTLYPSETVVQIDSMDDLPKLQETFAYLADRG